MSLDCTPMAIVRRLGKTPYEWQDEVMRDVMPKGSQTSLRAANEAGKTSIICVGIIMWHMLVFTHATVVITSGSWLQLKEQVFGALIKRQSAFPGFRFNESDIIGPDGNVCIGFSTKEPGRAEGWHAIDHDESPLLMIIDEGKTVPDSIYTAVDRCHPTRLLVMSSPGAATGAFYRIHTKERAAWKLHVVTAYQCPHIPLDTINKMIEKYGLEHPLVRSMIFAEWMMNGDTEKFVLPWAQLDPALERPPAQTNEGDVEAFVDFARSPKGDEVVLAVRRGNKITIEEAFKGSGDSVRDCHRLIVAFEKHRLKQEWISGDEGGMGATYCDVLATMGWTIGRVNNQSASTQPRRYANLGTEMWFEFAALILGGQIILPGAGEKVLRDDKLNEQLTSRQYLVTLKGQLILMSKDDQPGPSPDRGDAVVGCCRRFNRIIEVQDIFKPSGFHGLDEALHGLPPEGGMGNSWMSDSV